MAEILGYFGAIIIGMVLGLIGGGGSILTVPVLAYLMGINPVLATAYSLFIVGLTSAIGTIRNLRQGLVDVKTAAIFSIPAFTAVYATRKYIVPAIPDPIFTTESMSLSKSMGIMIFFAIIMLLASISMISTKSNDKQENNGLKNGFQFSRILLLLIEGGVVGVLTGLVGAGGGFLIIPALVLLAKLPMKRAVATSLLIIAIKSLIGFIGDVENMEIDWMFLLLFSSLSVIGIFVGTYYSKFITGKKLKTAFGWFVLFMAVYIFIKELFLA